MTHDLTDTSAPLYIEGGTSIGRIVLNRPDKMNAMSEAMWGMLAEAAVALDNDPAVRVIVVSSTSPKAFSAGADIAELEIIAKDAERRESNRQAIRTAQRTLARTKKATIAEIGGACIGGGCGIAIHCDFRIASEKAKFGITPAKLGIIYPLNDTRQLMDLVGPANAKSILFTGRIFGAAEALGMGLIDDVCDAEGLRACADTLAENIASVSQYSVQGMKATIRSVLDGQLDDDDATARMFRAAHEGMDAQEGVRAFLEKRSPNFSWND